VEASVAGELTDLELSELVELLRDLIRIKSVNPPGDEIIGARFLEKVFAEEVEAALTAHPAVNDVIVCGRPNARWGSEVVAIVELAEGFVVTDEELLEEAERHVARYKLPKAIIRREHLERSPSGKADYRWARSQAESA